MRSEHVSYSTVWPISLAFLFDHMQTQPYSGFQVSTPKLMKLSRRGEFGHPLIRNHGIPFAGLAYTLRT